MKIEKFILKPEIIFSNQWRDHTERYPKNGNYLYNWNSQKLDQKILWNFLILCRFINNNFTKNTKKCQFLPFYKIIINNLDFFTDPLLENFGYRDPQCGQERKGIFMSIDYLFNLSFTLILIYYLFHFQFYKTVALRDCEVAFLQEI